MREGDWQEILQHPNRALTRGQWELLDDLNIAKLSHERKTELLARLLIEGRRLFSASQVQENPRAPVTGGKRTYEPDFKKEKKR